MSLKEYFEAAVRELRKREVRFAVAGGFAADLYRHEPRLTMDVDLAIVAQGDAVKPATDILESIGLQAGILRRADMDGGPLFAIKKRSTEPCMVIGRVPGAPDRGGVDFLLPTIPWTDLAVDRAQHNLVDFGFGDVPALTVEDVVLAKLYALQRASLRAKDLDDLQSIFHDDPRLDGPYLAGQIGRLALSIPKAAHPFLPRDLLKTLRDAARAKRAAGPG